MSIKNEDYDFEERAAIREFDGGLPRGTAEFFAHEEIAARTAQQGCLARRRHKEQIRTHVGRQEIRQTISAKPDKQELRMLQDQRDEVGSRMRAETDEQRKDELLDEWMKLTNKIIELRKES